MAHMLFFLNERDFNATLKQTTQACKKNLNEARAGRKKKNPQTLQRLKPIK